MFHIKFVFKSKDKVALCVIKRQAMKALQGMGVLAKLGSPRVRKMLRQITDYLYYENDDIYKRFWQLVVYKTVSSSRLVSSVVFVVTFNIISIFWSFQLNCCDW